jgi:putative aldouronate transport system permease protein
MLLYEIRDHHVTRYYPTVLIFPFFLSWVIISSMVYAFLSPSVGLVNGLLTRFGIEPVMWYFRPEYWRVILTIVNLWATVGYGVVIYYSGMLAINPEYFEAAMVDGASGWRRTWHITLPLLSPLIIINVLLAIGNMFRANFMLFYLVPRNSGPLLSTTDVLDTYVYRALTGASGGSTMLGGGAVGMAAAAGLYQALVGLVLVLVSNWIIRRLDRDKALF